MHPYESGGLAPLIRFPLLCVTLASSRMGWDLRRRRVKTSRTRVSLRGEGAAQYPYANDRWG